MITKKRSSSTQAFVSVIIPVYNDTEALSKTLSELLNQSYPVRLYEVIVVDNGSDQDTFAAVKNYQNIIYATENKAGSYAARNKGITLAKGDILAFIDAGCIPAHGWLEQGVNSLNNVENAGLVGGRIKFSFLDQNKPTTIELYDSMMNLNTKNYIEEYNFSCTANLFTYRRVMEDVGLFNDSLKSGGDYEWGNRVFDRGYRLIYADKVVVTHPARNSLKELYNKALRIGGGLQGVNRISNRLESFPKRMLPPVKRILRIIRDDQIATVWQKMKLMLLIVFLKYVALLEEIKVSIRGNARRS
jgi:glycosyltransferase involved in cell wall biosynthesis